MNLLKSIAAGSVAVALSVSAATANGKRADVVQTAVDAGSFKTLVAAVTAVRLLETLQGPGPFIVFAPTDEAFARLATGTIENLPKPKNKSNLDSYPPSSAPISSLTPDMQHDRKPL